MVFWDFFFQFLLSIKILKLSLGFRVGNFCDSGSSTWIMALFLQIVIRNENENFYFRVQGCNFLATVDPSKLSLVLHRTVQVR